MIFLGVDPGLSGALAWTGDDGSWAVPMPLNTGGKRRSIDVAALRVFIEDYPPDLAVVEEVSPAPVRGRVQGGLSMFSFGRGLGQIEGVLTALGVPYVLARPQTWKAAVLPGTAKDKAAAVAFCRRRFPGVGLTPGRCRKPHDGIADALCLADYARRLQGRPEGAGVAS